MTDLERRVLHERVQHWQIDWRFVDLNESVLHPRFVVVTRREVRRELNAYALGQLGVHVQVGRGIVEAVADGHQAITIGVRSAAGISR